MAPAFSIVLPPRDIVRARELVRFMKTRSYIDFQTSVVMVDLAVVNVMLKRIVFVRCTVEFTSAGGALSFVKQLAAPPHVFPQTPADILLTLSLLLFYLYFLYDAVCDIKTLGWKMFSNKSMVLHHLNVFIYFIFWAAKVKAGGYIPQEFEWFSDAAIPIKPYLEFTKVANELNACNAFLSWFKMVRRPTLTRH
jgi:hypothetical protein